MDKLKSYRQIIQEVLTQYASYSGIPREIETQTVFDTERDHYQIVNVGWQDLQRTYGCPIHIDIKNGEVWIQQNLTEFLVAEDLVEKGIPKEDIVLAFHPPYKRPYTGFGVGV